MTTRIILDTSVWVSALLSSNGASRVILRDCLLKKFQPLMGTTLYQEYKSLNKRSVLFHKCPLSFKEREELMDSFMSVCEWVHVYYLWRPNLPDEADNHLMELAVAGNAEIIVTHNIRDFKQSELLFPEIEIMQPRQLLRMT